MTLRVNGRFWPSPMKPANNSNSTNIHSAANSSKNGKWKRKKGKKYTTFMFRTMKANPTIHLFFLFSLFSIYQILADTITTTHFLKDGEPNITSSGGSFQMGFFSPGNSKNRYVGIWYSNISVTTVVWVANREAPLATNSGTLKVIKPGRLVIVNDTNHIIWSTNTSRSAQNPVAKLLDSGNLVVIDADADGHEIGDFLWQSFDYPTDTLLPGMKIGWNFVTGREVYLSSWMNEEDPAPGDYTYHCDPSGYLQNVLKKDSKEIYRSGPWNGLRFSGATNSRESPFYTFGVVSTKNEVYFTYHLLASVITRFCLNPNGVLQRWTWGHRNQGWTLYLSLPTDNCDTYKLCGGYGSCNSLDSPVCECLDKFVPKHVEDWGKADWSSGCARRTELNCIRGDVFLKYSKLKLPDTRNSWFNVSMNLEECRKVCLKNCSCMAYANLDIRNGGSGCLLWFEDLLDIRQLANEGQDVYIRMAASELCKFIVKA